MKTHHHNLRIISAGFGIIACAIQGLSAQTTFTLLDQAELVNHWPSSDGLIGTSDDVISGNPSTTNSSAPNTNGAASYNAFDFGQSSIPDGNLFPPGRQAITFLDEGNTVSVDMDVARNGGGPLILSWNLSGSEPFFGHGPYSAAITAVNSGSYNTANHSFSQNIDFSANLNSGLANSSSFDLSGIALVVESADYGNESGNDYVDDVLIPIAQAINADALFFAMGSGTVPPADNFAFGQMDITASLIGFVVDSEPAPLPALTILRDENSVTLSWPSSATNAVLESSTELETPEPWSVHAPPYSSDGDQNTFTYAINENSRFFRLRSP